MEHYTLLPYYMLLVPLFFHVFGCLASLHLILQIHIQIMYRKAWQAGSLLPGRWIERNVLIHMHTIMLLLYFVRTVIQQCRPSWNVYTFKQPAPVMPIVWVKVYSRNLINIYIEKVE